ncbi:MAG TPA: aldehyde dehydrogenase family protein [Solirubrobacteraceae bacterium]|nr:aldehyde dehydrogenase family protein [Solirubrobacteraceae bacterium]
MATVEQAQTTTDSGAPTVDVFCPADGRLVGSVPDMGAPEVEQIAAQLRAAQPAWEAIGPEGRARHMLAWLDWIFDNEDRILELVQQESGKSYGDTKIEILATAEVINYYAKHAGEFLADQHPRPHELASSTKSLHLFRKPYQLVGEIFPWNYPLAMPMLDVPPALMAGAAVLSKPSEFTPLAWTECVRGWNEIAAPPVLGLANGAGAAGAAVIDVVDMIMFTGSTRTGRKIAVRAAERLIPAALELGGKDAMIVLDDADMERAVNGATWGGLFNAGQTCIAVERVYVEEPIYDEFVAKLTEKVSGLRTGMDAPGTYQSDLGSLATEAQLEIVERHVQDAKDRGARVLTGGKPTGQGLIYEPTVLVDVDHTMQCMTEETFGPTIPVMKVANEAEAIRLANDSPYGLNGSVYTGDNDRGIRVARQMETGGVSVNNAMMTLFQFPLPFGGWKESGIGGRFGGPAGLLKYCRQQSVTTERIKLASEIHWYPYTKRRGRVAAHLTRILGARGWRRRLGLKRKGSPE